MRSFFIVAAVIALSAAVSVVAFNLHQDIVEFEWNEFKDKYNKTYKNVTEHNLRQRFYLENRYMIAKHNAKYNSANVSNSEKPSFKLGLNEYADMLSHEFVARMNGYKPHLKKLNGSLYVPIINSDIPTEKDWRTEGYVSEVKNQGDCGSCWAFAATGALESQTYRKNGKKVSLSEQNLVDCSNAYGNLGCNGGWMDYAYKYIKDNKGIDTEKSYPYEAMNGECRYNASNKGAEDKGFFDIESGNEDALLNAVATIGPISVAIDASRFTFQLYQSGVYDDPNCSNYMEGLNHGVLVVGYGVDAESGKKYWLVKNSWGSSYGDNGYIRMVRGKDNQCGIATAASYPNV